MALQVALLGCGSTGTIYRLNSFVVVKIARLGKDEESSHAAEQSMFLALSDVPYLIKCFHQVPRYTFLEFAPQGSLADELNRHQERDAEVPRHVLRVTQSLDIRLVHRWMKQLCYALVSFEKAGFAHGDIRPSNLLLSKGLNLRLADLDRTVRVGDGAEPITPPFGRLLTKGEAMEGEIVGSFSKAGTRTETFAIGSVFYSLLRGHDMFEREYWGKDHGPILIRKLQDREFPALTDSRDDLIIRKFWNGDYKSVEELLAEFDLDVSNDDEADESLMRKAECEVIL